MPSAMWAGEWPPKEPKRIRLMVRAGELQYKLEFGLPVKSSSCFSLDPEIKDETVHFVEGAKKVELLRRKSGMVTARDAVGKRVEFPISVSTSESVLSSLREPHKFPELSNLREQLTNWRFYHQFRVDSGSPIRQPQVGVRTAVLSHDGMDLAAALQTIREIGDTDALNEAVANAFPGASLSISSADAIFSLNLTHNDVFARAFTAREMSDGTLQYLCLLAALLSPRPPALLVLNEPETSVHSQLMEPLARLIADASRYSQIWVTTHSRDLANFIEELTGYAPIELEKVDGETRIIGAKSIPTDDDDDD